MLKKHMARCARCRCGRACERCQASRLSDKSNSHFMTPVKIWLGYPYPLGATWLGNGVNFAIFSETATSVDLCLFDQRRCAAGEYSHSDDGTDQTKSGTCFCRICGRASSMATAFRVPTIQSGACASTARNLLIDPYAKAIAGQVNWADEMFGYVVGGPRMI